MKEASRSPRQWCMILTALVIVGGMWGYFDRVVIPGQRADELAKNRPSGNFSDLYPRWFGAREFILHGRDPYSAEVTADIQTAYFGRPIDSRKTDEPKDESRFAYPLFIVFLLAPTITLPFGYVQLLFVILATALSISSVYFWSRVFGSRISAVTLVVGSLLLLASFPVAQSLHLQQPVLIVAGLIAGAAAALTADWLWAAGIMLALAMIKPQATLPVAAWFLLWAVFRWRERKGLVVSFAATMAALLAAAELTMPGWFWRWRDAVTAYMQYAPLPPPHIQLLFGKWIGTMLGAAVLLGVGVFCWKARKDSVQSDRFLLAGPLILTASLVLSPVWHPYDQILLLPAALLGFCWRHEIAKMSAPRQLVVILSGIIVSWQWISALALSLTAIVSPNLAQGWQILPWISIVLSPTFVLVSLALIGRARLSAADLG